MYDVDKVELVLSLLAEGGATPVRRQSPQPWKH